LPFVHKIKVFIKRLDKSAFTGYTELSEESEENSYYLNGVVKMVEENEAESCCLPTDEKTACCKVEALVSIDERGQMVLPKETRDKANIRAGDKLVVTSWEKDGKICCLSLVKAEDLTEMVKGMLGPVMNEILQK